MSDEPKAHTSRFGAILVMLAVGGSAIGVVGWHLMSNRSAGLDTSGFDMSVAPDSPRRAAVPAPVAAADPAQQSGLGMLKADAGMRVMGPGTSTPRPAGASGATPNPTDPKEAAALTFKEAAIKNERLVDAFVRRMEAKHPSITRFGKDWAASPELRALRDQYWKGKDPMKFAYGIAKSGDFGKLVKKYAGDAGIRDALISGFHESPPGLLGALGGVLENDKVAKSLVNTVITAFGLPASLAAALDGSSTKPPDSNQMVSEIINSAAVKNQKGAVSLDQKDIDKAKEQAPNNGFRPLGGR